ncbi:MAG: YicC family protein [Rhodospirillales bacterium]|nr:YicC family protein [Rhodospirillales bacterium]
MTGFARIQGGDDVLVWLWEARSVNGKVLDVRCRLPHGFDRLEQAARDGAAKVIARGNVTLSLTINRKDQTGALVINEQAFVRVAALAREFQELEGIAPPTLDGLLRLPGVIETGTQASDDLDDERHAAITADLQSLLKALAQQRTGEGARLLEIIGTLIAEIADLVAQATDSAGAQPEAIRDRLIAQIADLTKGKSPVTQERLAQEVTLLVTRADVREEIDRLNTHIAAVRELLASGAVPGRRLGFLCQELLRETNTLCSKSSDKGLTAIGLDLKVAIDRLREQALNVE